MKIYKKSEDGSVYKVNQTDKNTFTFKTEDKSFELFITESPEEYNLENSTENLQKKMTKAIFSNKEILDQLSEARKNRDKQFSYYSGDEKQFDKLVVEVNTDECRKSLRGYVGIWS